MSDFDVVKERTLSTLLQTLNGQRDFSPKGFVDTPVIDVLELINSHTDYVSTSSCSGRIALYEAVKDKGVQWLLVKHGPITIDEVQNSVNCNNNDNVVDDMKSNDNSNNFLMLKCESFILHILCRDLHCAKLLLNIALECGYRESGITLGKGSRVMLAVRTTAFGLEVPIAIKSSSSSSTMLFTNPILSLVIKEANKKLLLNFARIDNFLSKLKNCWRWPKVVLSNENETYRRWGHACIQSCSDPSYFCIYGGYGINETNTDVNKRGINEKSSRKLSSIALSFDPMEKKIVTLLDETNAMHSAVEILWNTEKTSLNNDKFYIVSGGRAGPSSPLPCLVIYDKNFKKVAINEEGDVPSNRWGHSLNRFNSNSPNKTNCYFLFGGRSADTLYGDAYVLSCQFESNLIRCTWTKLWDKNDNIPARFFHSSVGIPDNINNSDHNYDEHAHDSRTDYDVIELILIHGGLLSLEEPITDSSFLLVKPSTHEVRQMVTEYSSNTIVSRFAHSITYIGKNTLLLVGGTSFDENNNNSNSTSTDCFQIDFVRCIDDENNVSITGSIQPLQISNTAQLPCVKCRCHHQAVYNSSCKSLYLIGGGQLCLGFGAHYCQSLTLKITHDYEEFNASEQPQSTSIKSSKPTDSAAGNNLVIFISSQLLKRAKTFLEGHKFFDKTRRISPAEGDIRAVKGMFAVPVQLGFLEFLRDGKFDESAIKELACCVSSTKTSSKIIPVNVSGIVDNNETSDSISLWYGFQNPFLNKTITTSGHRKAFEYLENTISSIPKIDDETAKQLRGNLPKKFEFVGDVLMIPSETFNCTEWENIIKGDQAIMFWEGLAKCFGLSRVARKSKIDSGPKRESKVLLLLPPDGQPQETGPSSVGWVTVTENSVQYSFDITRVMFCSGNITEKIRMSKESCTGQTIVDLYCGIGYYTLPFLIHGNAAHVHACEWNSNSVLALTENFKNNKIHSSRYSIYENDNRITAPTLRNIADRVCLGLLPSSEQGWPLAAMVLKPTGGILHVHENVNDNKIEQFSEYLLKMLGTFFHNEGKNFNFKIIKTEKVKSYAPHVLHIVFDVLCLPI